MAGSNRHCFARGAGERSEGVIVASLSDDRPAVRGGASGSSRPNSRGSAEPALAPRRSRRLGRFGTHGGGDGAGSRGAGVRSVLELDVDLGADIDPDQWRTAARAAVARVNQLRDSSRWLLRGPSPPRFSALTRQAGLQARLTSPEVDRRPGDPQLGEHDDRDAA